MTKLEDNNPMPFGKRKGKKMIDVPADYLLWLHDQGMNEGNVKVYIEENMQALKEEAAKKGGK